MKNYDLNNLKSARIECMNTIEDLGIKYQNMIHLTSDGNDYLKKNPERSFDVGIAEENLINIAAGFALTGKPVVVNAISSFMIYNAYLQIRNSLCYHNLKVIMLGIGGGLSYGHLGFSHHSLEDIAVLKSLPNMKIYLPADPDEASLALEDAIKKEGPSYIRIRSGMEPIVTENVSAKSRFNGPYSLTEGNDVLLFSYGASLTESIKAHFKLKKIGIGLQVVNVNTLNVYQPKEIFKMFKGHKFIVTIDEHYVDSGAGSYINRIFLNNCRVPIFNLGIENKFCTIGGSSAELMKYFGIDSASVERFIKNKIHEK